MRAWQIASGIARGRVRRTAAARELLFRRGDRRRIGLRVRHPVIVHPDFSTTNTMVSAAAAQTGQLIEDLDFEDLDSQPYPQVLALRP